LSGNFVYVEVAVSGSEKALAQFRATYLPFSFTLVEPPPSRLNLDRNNLVQTGYQALYGEWEAIAKQWMLKEPASRLGLPFPLTSREGVVSCLELLEEQGHYLGFGREYKRNLDDFGHGTLADWCDEHWGTSKDAEGVRASEDNDGIILRFVADKYPKKLLTKLSMATPGLEMRVTHFDERCRKGAIATTKGGQQVGTVSLSREEMLSHLQRHRDWR